MRVYHFLSRTYGLDDIKRRRLKISRVQSLNDPFEFIGADLSDYGNRQAIRSLKSELGNKIGIICFCKSWNNPLMWGHYAERHQGLCLGFDVDDSVLKEVKYVDQRFEWPEKIDEDFTGKLICTKFSHWSYEEECRIYCSLLEQENGLYFQLFSEQMKLKEVIVGCESTITRAEVESAIGNLGEEVHAFKARAAFRNFRIVENENEALWE